MKVLSRKEKLQFKYAIWGAVSGFIGMTIMTLTPLLTGNSRAALYVGGCLGFGFTGFSLGFLIGSPLSIGIFGVIIGFFIGSMWDTPVSSLYEALILSCLGAVICAVIAIARTPKEEQLEE